MTRLSFGGFLNFPQESESKKTFEEGLRIAADNVRPSTLNFRKLMAIIHGI